MTKNKENYERRKLNGICIVCSNDAVPRLTMCKIHLVMQVGSRGCGNGTKAFAEMLLEIFEKQERQCPYTGEHLSIGDNASLDHVKPKSRFPELIDEPSNLQWVTKRANTAKQDMTHEEFISFCKTVVDLSERYNPVGHRFLKPERYVPIYQNREWLTERYVDKKMSTDEIAELCGVTKVPIYYWLNY